MTENGEHGATASCTRAPGPGASVQIAVAPCSPFSVTKRLMTESAELARRLGLTLHTHLAETMEEEAYCMELYGATPVEYLTDLGWLGADVWCAHCVHLSADDTADFAASGTGVAHCPTSNLRLGAGVAPVREYLDAGVRVGLGVDGSASNERSDLMYEVKQALLVARGRGGPRAMTVREALRLGTRGGAEVLGREDIGSLEPGKRADFAVWRTDGLELGGADVWCAHCVHLSADDTADFAASSTGVAHCPTSNLRLGAGVAPVREYLDAGVRVGLGVDGSASNERSDLLFEVKQALLVARGRGGPRAMTAREALRLGTRGGAGVLGRDDIGSLEPGKRADFAVWRTDGLELGGADDPVAGLVFSAPHRVDRLVVEGADVVRDGALVNADETEIARAHRVQARRFAA